MIDDPPGRVGNVLDTAAPAPDDVRLSDVKTAVLRHADLELARGGVIASWAPTRLFA